MNEYDFENGQSPPGKPKNLHRPDTCRKTVPVTATMETDAHLYEIFRDHPEWIGDLMNEPFPEPGKFRSITIKKVERRLDGLLIPANPRKPMRVIEFQFFPSSDIYLRATEQRIAVHRLFPGRQVEAIIFFASRRLDMRPVPWTSVVNAVYLDEEMIILSQRQPAHPLPKLLAPVFEKSDAKLEAEAAEVYQGFGRLKKLSAAERETLQLIYSSLLIGRFKHKTTQEITAMITSLDITKTRAGKELIAIGKAEGKAQTLMRILQKRFGSLPKSAVTHIEHMDYLQLEQLEDCVLDLTGLPQLSQWLRKTKRR